MQTDTVVGIVGAVVLVSVMVGVFAYEYNNPGDSGDGGGGDDANDVFQEAYPTLAADDDIDGDGIRNAEDDDIDGDGTANAEDEDVSVAGRVSGTVAQSAGSAQSDEQTFRLGTGATMLDLEITYQRPAPLPGSLGQQPRLNFVLTDPNGQTFDGQETVGGAGDNTVTITWAVGANPLAAGEWTLTASSNNAVAPSMSYEGDLLMNYDAA